MTEFKQIDSQNTFMGRFGYGCDLLEELTRVATSNGVKLGRVEAIGAVQQAKIAFYNQATQTYQVLSLDHPLEITTLSGNISLKDGNPFVHAHITLSDESGKSYGGHLLTGTIVFSCEFIVEAFDGPVFDRGFDKETGLRLWFTSHSRTICPVHKRLWRSFFSGLRTIISSP
jgi:uncharacterized protein